MPEQEEHPESLDLSRFYVIPEQEVHLIDFDNQGRWVLDIGGGGEGIIGMLKGREVIAIDRIKEELAETNNDALKIIMDTKALQFLDSSFSFVTAFFTFMYIPLDDFENIFTEIWRVLKPRGELLVWEPTFSIPNEEQSKKRAVIFLKIHFPDGRINQTGYGGILRDQDLNTIIQPAQKVGFKVLEKRIEEHHFFVKLQKP